MKSNKKKTILILGFMALLSFAIVFACLTPVRQSNHNNPNVSTDLMEWGNYKNANATDTFILYTNADPIDTDGIFDLWWDDIDANSYSIYYSDEYFYDLNNSTVLYAGITNTSQEISGLPDGEYYFRVLAYTNNDTILSDNCIHVYIQYNPNAPPGDFTLYQISYPIYVDTGFSLNWTQSTGADYYYVYHFKTNTSGSNPPFVKISEEIYTNMYYVDGLPLGIHNFKVVAYNNYGQRTSNCIEINVKNPESSSSNNKNSSNNDNEGEDTGEGEILTFGFYLLFPVFGISAALILTKHKK